MYGDIQPLQNSAIQSYPSLHINPYLSISSFFVGHMQTLETQIKPQNGASDQSLHCSLAECYINFFIKMKNITKQPLNRNWTAPIDSIRLTWVKYIKIGKPGVIFECHISPRIICVGAHIQSLSRRF